MSALLIGLIAGGALGGVAGYIAGIQSERRFHALQHEAEHYRAMREPRGKDL